MNGFDVIIKFCVFDTYIVFEKFVLILQIELQPSTAWENQVVKIVDP
jgi:hypothetical protein